MISLVGNEWHAKSDLEFICQILLPIPCKENEYGMMDEHRELSILSEGYM
jgi:hypothetical protein